MNNPNDSSGILESLGLKPQPGSLLDDTRAPPPVTAAPGENEGGKPNVPLSRVDPNEVIDMTGQGQTDSADEQVPAIIVEGNRASNPDLPTEGIIDINSLGNDRFPIFAPKDAKQVKEAQDDLGDAINVDAQNIREQSERQLEIAERRNEEVEVESATMRNLLEQSNASVEEYQAEVAPMIDEMGERRRRMEELEGVSWLEKGIKGIFDKNFDETWQEERYAELQQRVAGATQEYSAEESMRDELFNNMSQMSTINDKDAASDLTLASTKMSASAAILGTQTRVVEYFNQRGATQMQQLQMNETAANLLLDEMDPKRLYGLASEAKQKGGFIEVDGTRISHSQLLDRARNEEKMEISMRSARLAESTARINNSRAAMALRNDNLNNAMQFASPTELEKAFKTGSFRGQRVPAHMIAPILERAVQAEAARLQYTMGGSPAARFSQQTQSAAQQFKTLQRSVSNAGPSRSGITDNDYQALERQWTQLDREIKRLGPDQVNTEAGRIALQGLLTGIQAQQQALVQRAAKRMSGGDKDLQAVWEGYYQGQAASPAEAGAAMLNLYDRGELDDKFGKSPATRAMAKASKDIIAEYDRNNPDAKKADRKKELGVLLQNATNAFNLTAQDNFLASFPKLAKDLGLPNAERFDQNEFGKVWQASILKTQTSLAARAGISEGEAARILNNPALATDEKVKEALASFNEQGIFQAHFIRGLNNSKMAANGFKPGDAMIDLMQSTKFQQQIGLQNQSINQSSIGAFMSGSLNPSGLSQTVNNWVRNGQRLAVANNSKDYLDSMMERHMFQANGTYRAEVILGSMAGITTSERTQLINALRSQANGRLDAPSLDAGILENNFENPELEKIRQKAAKEWRSAEEVTKKVFQSQRNFIERWSISDPYPEDGSALSN